MGASVKHVADDRPAKAESMGGMDTELVCASCVRVEDYFCRAVF